MPSKEGHRWLPRCHTLWTSASGTDGPPLSELQEHLRPHPAQLPHGCLLSGPTPNTSPVPPTRFTLSWQWGSPQRLLQIQRVPEHSPCQPRHGSGQVPVLPTRTPHPLGSVRPLQPCHFQLKAARPYSRKPPLPAACPLGSLPPKLAVAWDLSLPCPATDHRHIGPSHLDAYTANDSETTDRATKLIHTGKRDV